MVVDSMRRTQASRLRSLQIKKAAFDEPMECLSVSKLPEGSEWLWEIKLDHYRAIEVKTSETILYSYSRNHKTFNKRFPLPAGTVIDGEVVALSRRIWTTGFSPSPTLHSRSLANSLLCKSLCDNGKVVQQDSGRRSAAKALRSHCPDVPAEFSAQW